MLRDIFSGICRVRTDCGESWRKRQGTRMEDGEGRWKADWEGSTQVKFYHIIPLLSFIALMSYVK